VRAEQGRSELHVRVLLAELRDAPPPAGIELARRVARRASQQQTALTLVQLLVAIARALPQAAILGMGRRR
jgi:hypothetical protein